MPVENPKSKAEIEAMLTGMKRGDGLGINLPADVSPDEFRSIVAEFSQATDQWFEVGAGWAGQKIRTDVSLANNG
jgi:hypothetical protein